MYEIMNALLSNDHPKTRITGCYGARTLSVAAGGCWRFVLPFLQKSPCNFDESTRSPGARQYKSDLRPGQTLARQFPPDAAATCYTPTAPPRRSSSSPMPPPRRLPPRRRRCLAFLPDAAASPSSPTPPPRAPTCRTVSRSARSPAGRLVLQPRRRR
jgi:hypothetical protein